MLAGRAGTVDNEARKRENSDGTELPEEIERDDKDHNDAPG